MSDVTAASSPPSEGLDRGLIVIASVVVLGTIMSILDTTVVNVALKTLAGDFHANLASVQWVATGYTLALAAVIPLTGWAADRFGTKRLYMLTIALFVAGSCLAGLAWSIDSLIFFRVLQGIGGGMLMPVGMTILTRAAGPSRMGRIMGLIGVPMLLGPVLGPILGGWLVEDLSWRWIFFINLPIGICAFCLAIRVLPKDTSTPGVKLDWFGLGTLSPSLALIVYGLAESSTSGGFGATKVIVPVIVGAVLLVTFVINATRRPVGALLDLRLFLNRVYSGAMVTMLLMIGAVFGAMLLVPLYLQSVRGESALMAGVLLAPQGLGVMVMMPIAGRLADRTGIGRFVPIGLGVVALGFLALSQIGAHTSYVWLSVILFVQGLGMGTSMMPTFSGALQTLAPPQIARGTTMLNINRQIGASLGTAILSVLLAARLTDRFGAHSAGSSVGASLPHAARVADAGRMASAYGAVFMVAFVLVVISTVVAGFVLPKHRPAPTAPSQASSEAAAEAAIAELV